MTICHELARAVEAAHVADLGHESDCGQKGHATQGLVGRHHRCHGPRAHCPCDLLGQALEPGLGVCDCLAVLRQHEMLGGMLEALLAEPAGMRLGPGCTPCEDPTMAEEE